MKVSGIYAIRNLSDGKMYIGSSQDLQVRFYNHKRNLQKGIHANPHLQRAWNRDGNLNFSFELLEECSNAQLQNREQYYIDLYESYLQENGYNISRDTKSFMRGIIHKDKTKRLMSIVQSGKRNHFYGKHHTQETKQKIAAQKIGKYLLTDEQCRQHSERMSGSGNPMFGKKHTEETLNKLRRPKTEEEKRKISLAKKGTKYGPFSDEHRKNLSESLKGRIGGMSGKRHSEETKLKMSKTRKGLKYKKELAND